MPTDISSYLTDLHLSLDSHFNLDEIRTLCLKLGIDFDNIPGDGKSAKIRGLILFLARQSRLHDLVETVIKERPKIEWAHFPDDFQLPSTGDWATPSQSLQMIVHGDLVHGDKTAGYMVGRDKITTKDISGSVAAIGDGATVVSERGVLVTGTNQGTINTGDTINYYVNGAKSKLPHCTVGIENFLTTYLGTKENPVPFGGREEEMAQLNSWLITGNTQRLILIASAGRGKSALLVRWSQQLTAVENLDVIFIPISIRFQTNLENSTFYMLATRLAHFYGKEIPTDYAQMSP